MLGDGIDRSRQLPRTKKWPLTAVESFSECWEKELIAVDGFPEQKNGR